LAASSAPLSHPSLKAFGLRADEAGVEAARLPSRLLGELLVDDGLITADELEQALAAQAQSGKRLGEVLVEQKLVSGPELTSALMQQFGVEMSTQTGFGSGLWGEIKRRHRESREVDVDPNYTKLVPVADAEPEEVVLPTYQPPESAPAAGETSEIVPAKVAEVATFAARLQAADEELMLEAAYRENAERDLAAARAELEGRGPESAPALQAEVASLSEQLKAAEEEAEARRAVLAALEEQLAARPDTQEALDSLNARLAEAEAAREREAAERAEADALLEAAEDELAVRAERISELEELASRPDRSGEVEALTSRLSEARSRLDAEVESRERAETRIAELQARLKEAKAEADRAQKDDAERRSRRMAELEQALLRETGLREETEQELERLRGDLAGREQRVADLEHQHAELDGRLAETTAELAEERKRSATAEEELRGELDRVVARLAEAEATVAASATQPEEAFPDHVVFLPGESGYHLAELAGPPPEAGAVTEIEGVAFRVLKVGRSPLPDDPRRCAYLEAA
jgi:murein DD-endopeptidase MepM/ murein hydrolase activator NlpD